MRKVNIVLIFIIEIILTYINNILVLIARDMEKSLLVCGGASDDITGSGYVVGLDGLKIQVDGGSFQGQTTMRQSKEMFDKRIISQPDYAFITHSHIDHVAGLPIQYQNDGFPKNTKFLTSHMVKAVLGHVYEDTTKLQGLILKTLNRKSKVRSQMQSRRESLASVILAMKERGYLFTDDFKESFADEFQARSNGRKDKGTGEHKKRGKELTSLYNSVP